MALVTKGGFVRDDATGALAVTGSGSTTVNVKDPVYGAKGDGTTDDTAAITAADAVGATFLPAGTYLVSSRLTLTHSMTAAPGVTLKKAAAFIATPLLRVQTADITIDGLTIDGNVAAGALGRGIDWTGASASGGILRNVTIKNCADAGVRVDTSGADLTCFNCKSFRNRSGTGTALGTADGFYAVTSGVLRLHDCTADDNDRSGVFLDTTAGDRCVIDLRASRNLRAGATLRNSNGSLKSLTGDQNNRWGLECGLSTAATGVSGWDIQYVSQSNCGQAFTNYIGAVAQNTAGSGVELYAATNMQFAAVVCRDTLGYGVALTRESGTGVGCVGNKFASIVSDQTTAVDGDPALHVSGDSTFNEVGTLVVRGHTFAISTGEGVTGTPGDNLIGTLISEKCTVALWRCDAGTNNRIERVVDRDSYNANGSFPAQFWFSGSGITGNSIGSYTHRTVANPAPTATLTQVSSATGNWLEGSNTAARVSQERLSTQFTTAVAENFPRDTNIANLGATLTSQTVNASGILVIPAGSAAAGIHFVSGTTAMASPTNVWAGLVRVSDRQMLAISADGGGSDTWAANTDKAFTFGASWTADVNTACYGIVMVNATTTPSLLGHDWNSVQAAVKSTAPLLGATSDTGKTTPYAVGATIGGLTTSRLQPWCYVV